MNFRSTDYQSVFFLDTAIKKIKKFMLNLNKYFLLIPVFVLSVNLIYAEHPDTTLYKIKNHYSLILSASEKFDINPKILSSIIFVERTLNYDWRDEALDNIIAEAGLNSSIGFCQIKMKTAYWVEAQLNELNSEFNPGKKYSRILAISKSPKEIISKLSNDSLNILCASAYLRIIQSRWAKENCSIDNKPEIIGTLYSTGLFYRNGIERKPNKNPNANKFGEKVKLSTIYF